MLKTSVPSCVLLVLAAAAPPQDPDPPARTLELEVKRLANGVEVLAGTYEVFEDRDAKSGRRIGLNVMVLPATGPDPKPDPIVSLAGGPGQGATIFAASMASSPLRVERDILLVDQRGTGGSNPLHCDLSGGDGDPSGYLEPIFQEELFRDCLEALRKTADLTLYTTPIAMDDLDEVRAALGYEKVNLIGGSYGTRAALVYMRRHPETVRTATLKGVAPISFKNPLFHARGAQDAIDRVFEECERDPDCRKAFPNLREELATVLERLGEAPVTVEATSATTGDAVELHLSRQAFAEALRVMLYSSANARRAPLAIHRAFEGEYLPFARLGVSQNRGLRDSLAFGMLLCVTCAEDVARIEEDEIGPATEGTFLGDLRVRSQKAVCEFWPKGRIPDDYGEPVRCDAPTLVFSGITDPVTPPSFGEAAAKNLPNSLHLVVPRAHDLGGTCIDSIVAQLIVQGSVEGIDASCIESMRLPRFELAD